MKAATVRVDPQHPSAKTASIGTRIRILRRKQGRTVQEIADQGGFSKSLLSKIENNHITPAVATLTKIARALGTTVSALVAEQEEHEIACDRRAEAEERAVQTECGHRMFPFATARPGKAMQPFLFIARKGEVVEHHHSHDGEEFIYVVEGAMKFCVGDVTYLLRKGDGLYFDPHLEHGMTPMTDEVQYLNIFV